MSQLQAEQAQTRLQLATLAELKEQLVSDLNEVNKNLKKIDKVINEPMTPAYKKKVKAAKSIYEQNKKEIEFTIKETNKIINQITVEQKPRAYVQMTKRAF